MVVLGGEALSYETPLYGGHFGSGGAGVVDRGDASKYVSLMYGIDESIPIRTFYYTHLQIYQVYAFCFKGSRLLHPTGAVLVVIEVCPP